MSTLTDSISEPNQDHNSPVIADPVEDTPVLGNPPEPAEKNINPTLKCKNSTLKSYRQKLQAIQARIKYREKAIKGFRHHLKKGTFPKRFKSLRPFPKMDSPESQTIVNAACEQVHCIILDQMILDEEKKLEQDQISYHVMKTERESERSQLPRQPKKLSIVQLRQELAELQCKYAQLYQQLNHE